VRKAVSCDCSAMVLWVDAGVGVEVVVLLTEVSLLIGV